MVNEEYGNEWLGIIEEGLALLKLKKGFHEALLFVKESALNENNEEDIMEPIRMKEGEFN